MGNCQDCCTRVPSIPNYAQGKRTQFNPSQFVTPESGLRCEICGERKGAKLKEHLDYCHYATVQQARPSNFHVVCLLCGFKSDAPDQHSQHLKISHPYMESQTKSHIQNERRNQPGESNEKIKNRLRFLAKDEFTMGNKGKAEIQHREYIAKTYQKEYEGMEFSEVMAKADLVYRSAFCFHRDATYYTIQYKPQQKTIKAVATIFTLPNSI